MRIAVAAFTGTVIIILAPLATPIQAKSTAAQKVEERSTSSSCSAYQQAADGSWVQLPCKEAGPQGQAQTQHRPPAPGTDQEER